MADLEIRTRVETAQADRAFPRMTRQMRDVRRSSARLDRSLDKTSRATARAGRSADRASRQTEKLGRAAKQASGGVDQLTGRLQNLATAAAGLVILNQTIDLAKRAADVWIKATLAVIEYGDGLLQQLR